METPVSFESEGEAMRGILHTPNHGGAAVSEGVVFLHGWTGCRVGPHRMFVHTARILEKAGYASLRFDFRGHGESGGEALKSSIAGMISDTAAAVRFLRARVPLKRLVLLGICSGCKVAIAAATRDPELRDLVLWSPDPIGRLRSQGARAQRSLSALGTYFRKLAKAETWKKILSKRVNVALVRKAVFRSESADRSEIEQENAVLAAFRKHQGRLLMIYGSNDPETRATATMLSAFCRGSGIEHDMHEVPGANHSFYSVPWEQEVIGRTLAWIETASSGSQPRP